jgi:hypothetical protein
MVIHFLTLGRTGAEEGPAGEPKVFTLGVHTPGNNKVLLLSADGRENPLGLIITEEPQNPHCFSGNFLQRAEQGSLLVKGFACV